MTEDLPEGITPEMVARWDEIDRKGEALCLQMHELIKQEQERRFLGFHPNWRKENQLIMVAMAALFRV